MSQVSYVKIFNQMMDEFFVELIDIFPEEVKLKVHYNLFQTICKTNVKKPCNDFISGALPYLEKICMKDESIFTGDEKPELLDKINIKNIWTPDLSQNTKDAIWKYIKNFIAIGINIVQVPDDKIGLINFIINN